MVLKGAFGCGDELKKNDNGNTVVDICKAGRKSVVQYVGSNSLSLSQKKKKKADRLPRQP
jgi:hypothetical protein